MSGEADHRTGKETGTPADWQALRELVTPYCHGIDQHDIGLLRSIFHVDARLDSGAH
jgi:hypothetical protein